MLAISNRPHASRSSDFEITRAITPWIVLHSVQLLLLIVLVISNRARASRSSDFEITRAITPLIIYMKKITRFWFSESSAVQV